MGSKYRLTPKPGIARAGRFVKTKVKPIIVNNKNNSAKIPKEQRVSSVKINPPKKRQVTKSSSAVKAAKKHKMSIQRRTSKVRSQKELQQVKHNKTLEGLKNSGKGKFLVMVACGPSIMEADLPKLKGHPKIDIMSINKPDSRLHPTNFWVFCDQSQYKRNRELFESFPNTLINTWSIRNKHQNQILVKNKSGVGFSKNILQGYHVGRSTTYANMQVAFWMNYDKIYIFGCDMCKIPGNDQLHFYGKNPDVDPRIRVKRFEKEAESYMTAAKTLTPQERQKFVFCSAYNPWPFMEHFPTLDHREAVSIILEEAGKL